MRVGQPLLNGQLVLLLEPDAVAGRELRDELNDEGCAVAGPFATSAEALGFLDQGTPDLALVDLDFEPADGSALAEALRARGVGLVVLASPERSDSLPESLADVPRLVKPALKQQIRQELLGLL